MRLSESRHLGSNPSPAAMGEDITKSIQDWFKEKTSSPLYFTYIIFLVAWNWKLFYILFFEDASLLKTSHIEYISTFEFHINVFSNVFWSVIISWILNTGWHLIPPIIFTYLAIEYFPILHKWAHTIHIKNYFDRKLAWDNANLDYEKRRTKYLQQEVIQKGIQVSEKKKIEKIQTEEEKLEKELNQSLLDFQNLEAIKVAINVVYGTKGRYSNNFRDPNVVDGYRTFISSDFLSRLDTLGLITINTRETQIEFTNKGKYYIRKLRELGRIN